MSGALVLFEKEDYDTMIGRLDTSACKRQAGL